MNNEKKILMDIIETLETCPFRNKNNCSTCRFIRDNINFDKLKDWLYKGL